MSQYVLLYINAPQMNATLCLVHDCNNQSLLTVCQNTHSLNTKQMHWDSNKILSHCEHIVWAWATMFNEDACAMYDMFTYRDNDLKSELKGSLNFT